ncbi:rhodanese-like domain-containing protein [Microvirga sp. STR05]|uniref:Rhodanese-like domain-containing protein n=1 Tax=Hymenobacter duratus TaxID=2771356 RepID=A0ABR8JII6_9BACT|nr:rhodanese-like domain-containing protein [Hymenobacter duratus]MBD2714354.1 rhodanese-like domain-containing protein [Hymenobacter duratus]MBR7949257.1 rhodanese-like domain-containing protein [Microvirga sp. STR05]
MFGLFKSSGPSKYQNLPAAEFAEGVRQTGALVLDVRTPAEFAGGHLPGALNLDQSSPGFAQRVTALDKTRPTYVYCRSGARSANAATQMGEAGIEKVCNLAGGLLDWPYKLGR